jgi:diguanylate cyclase
MTNDDTEVAVQAQRAAEHEWADIIAGTSPQVRAMVADIIGEHKESLAGRFYTMMMGDAQARHFLKHEMVVDRLGKSMQDWLVELFNADNAAHIPAVVAHQRFVGEVHARIQLPINLVTRGARFMKRWIDEYLAQHPQLGRDDLLEATEYVDDLIDIAIELMSMAFVRGAERSARTEEAYRLYSLGQNISLERERQRAALLEWSHQVLFALHKQRDTHVLPSLGHSEFGLWLQHKALLMFEGSPEIEQITAAGERIDTQILPQLAEGASLGSTRLAALSAALQQEIAQIKYLLATLFDRYVEIENGRDVLTRLLNRRFLPATLTREIAMAKRTGTAFAVLLIDLDRFKRVNDTYGHDAGDSVLQTASTLIHNSVRAGDFIFRYGGEEILVTLVEVDEKIALRIAESIRKRIEQADFLIGGGQTLKVTTSIGVALYDGHPDYQHLIQRADAALYRAKDEGRNRCCLG